MLTKAYLTVDYEDYRRQELRDHYRPDAPANPDEVTRQTDILLETFAAIQASATFFAVGRLTSELPPTVWSAITDSHELGCHGHEHLRVARQGPKAFRADLRKAKQALEDRAGVSVQAFRAPYFSADGCEPWFGEVLADEGFTIDSSMRLSALPEQSGPHIVPGSGGAVVEVPLPSIGIGSKRLTVIGGTYFRLLPVRAIRLLLQRATQRGFTPMVYLHPYDLDPDAAALSYPRSGYTAKRLGDKLRRTGRASAISKLKLLAHEYEFSSISGAA